jgi:hypothetical protein
MQPASQPRRTGVRGSSEMPGFNRGAGIEKRLSRVTDDRDRESLVAPIAREPRALGGSRTLALCCPL